nr:hypothetical protein [Tanacetum cinerariifolium]
MSNSESDKMEGSSVLGSRLSEKHDHLPIKKRRFMFREPSPPTVEPTVDTPSQEGTESVAPCSNSVGQEEQQAKPEASCPPVASSTVSDLRQSGDTDTKVEEEKVVNECKKASEDEDTSKRALVDRPVCSDDTKSREVLATVKLEPNSVTLPDMSAKETDSRSLKSHSENVTSSALDCSSLGKATLDNARTPIGSENSNMNQVTSKKATGDEDTSNTSLVDRPAFSSDLGGSADTPKQGEGSKIGSDDMKSLKALATVKLEPNSVKLADTSSKQTDFSNDVASFRMNFSSLSKTTVDDSSLRTPLELKCSTMNQVTSNMQKSAEVDDRLNWDLNTVMDAWNEQPPVPDQHGNVADAVCGKADDKSINKESTPVGSEISPVVLNSLTPKIEKSELDECRQSGNGITKLLSPAMYSAPHVAVNKFFDNVAVPSTLTLEYRASDVSSKHLNTNGKGTDNLSRPMASGANFSRAISTLQTIENGKLNLSLVTAGSSENKVNQSGNTFDEDDKAQVKRTVSMLEMTERSQNGVGSGNNVNNVTVQTTENDKLSLSLATTASLENTFPHSESTCNEDDKSQLYHLYQKYFRSDEPCFLKKLQV